MRVTLFAVLALLATGCHAKFKKYAPTLGAVRVQVINTSGPHVTLGKLYGGDTLAGQIVATAVNVAQTVNEIELANRIASAVDTAAVNQGLEQGIAESLGSGPPFAYSDDAGTGPLLQLEVVDYGLDVPFLGAPGAFTWSTRARIYTGDGDRVYSHSFTCETGVGDPDAVAIALSVVNNMKQVDQMSDAEISDAFVTMARFCGNQFVVKMRRHAG